MRGTLTDPGAATARARTSPPERHLLYAVARRGGLVSECHQVALPRQKPLAAACGRAWAQDKAVPVTGYWPVAMKSHMVRAVFSATLR